MKSIINSALLAAAIFVGAATATIPAQAADGSTMHSYWIGR